MQKQTLALVVGTAALLAVGALMFSYLFPHFFAEDVVPLHQRSEASGGVDAIEPAPATIDVGRAARTEVENGARAADDGGASGLVTLQGRVMDGLGAPVGDATVWLEPSRVVRREGPRRTLPGPVKTGADGTFRVTGLRRGDRRVALRVTRAQYAPGMFDRPIGNVSEVSGAARLSLVASVGDLELSGGAEIRGRVTDLAGSGIAGATVQVVPKQRNRWRLVSNREKYLAAIETDADGYYRLAHVPAGVWSVVARAARYTKGLSSALVAAEGRSTQVADMQLGPGVTVSGSVQDHRGAPIAKASVFMLAVAMGQSAAARPRNELAATTDQQGRFLIRHVPATKMHLEVRADGYLHHAQEGTYAEIGAPLKVTMRDCLQITGSVLDDPSGQPVKNYAVRAMFLRGPDRAGAVTGGRTGGDVRSAPNARARAGGYAMERPAPHPNGEFVLGGLQEGVYSVAVQSADHAFLRTEEVEVRAGRAVRGLVLYLKRGFECAGSIVADDGRPIPGARVELKSGAYSGPPLVATANSAGMFAIQRAPAGEYQMSVVADGFRSRQAAPIELFGDRADSRIVLLRLGELTGSVQGLRAADIVNARVFVIRMSGNQAALAGTPQRSAHRSARIEADQTYKIRELEPGDYLVRAYLGLESDVTQLLVRQASTEKASADVRVIGGETSQLDLQLMTLPAGTVTGLVFHNGEAAKGFRIELAAIADNTAVVPAGRRARVASGGTFRVDRVAVGKYVLRVRSSGRATVHEETIEVVANVAVHRDIRVLTASLNGAVTVDDGTDVRQLSGEVALLAGLTELPEDYRPSRSRGGRGSIHTRLRAGKYEFETVQPGNYLIVVTIPGRKPSAVPVVIRSNGSQQLAIPAGELQVGRRR
jgi:hypothetical protein